MDARNNEEQKKKNKEFLELINFRTSPLNVNANLIKYDHGGFMK